MYLWQLCRDLGLLPYPHLVYLNIVRAIGPCLLAIGYAKYHNMSIPGNVDGIQAVLYLLRGIYEVASVGVHNWRLVIHKQEMSDILNGPGVQDITFGKPVFLSVFTNLPLILFEVYIGIHTKFFQPTNIANIGLIICDVFMTLIILQFSSLLRHFSYAIWAQCRSQSDLFLRAKCVYDHIDLARKVEESFRLQNFTAVVRVMYSILYTSYVFIRFPSESYYHKAYRIAYITTNFANLYYIVEASMTFRKAVIIYYYY